jgi:formate hydrogenlyase subunit 3/multisubunit Na+/H+ antiporter MnhD subunit
MTPRQLVATIAVWALALVLIITGISFITTVTGVKWTDNGDGSSNGEPYDIVGVGTGLLCVGFLVLATLLILEAYRPRVSGSASTPDA